MSKILFFRREFIPSILSGRKTQSRRLKKPKVKAGELCELRSGRRREDAFALAEILDLRCERLSEISEEDVRAEGMNSKEEFLRKFREIYKLSEEEDPEVWVVKFRVVRKLSPSRSPRIPPL